MKNKYWLKKEKARQFAIYWQSRLNSPVLHSWGWCMKWEERFRRIGKKYGLLKEFRENGIL